MIGDALAAFSMLAAGIGAGTLDGGVVLATHIL
jgi:hypothetical protein